MSFPRAAKAKAAEKVGSVRKSWEGGKREQEGKRERANVQLFNAGSTAGWEGNLQTWAGEEENFLFRLFTRADKCHQHKDK